MPADELKYVTKINLKINKTILLYCDNCNKSVCIVRPLYNYEESDMYSTTPPTHIDSQYGNITSTKSYMYSTKKPTHTDPQYGNTTSTKSLTCTPQHHRPTLTLSLVTPLVPRE